MSLEDYPTHLCCLFKKECSRDHELTDTTDNQDQELEYIIV
jgi:hypothetical protein